MSAGDNFRTRRSALNFATGLLGTAATIAVAFITTPLLLRWLGTERFGAVRTTADWFGHIALVELGLAGAIAPLLAMAVGRGDRDAVRRTMAQGIRAYLRVAAAAVAAGLILTALITRLVPVGAALVPDLRIACVIAVGGLLLYPLAPFRTLADASQRGWLINIASLAQSLVTTAAAVVLAYRGAGITGQFAALFIGQALFFLVLTRDGLARNPGVLRAAAREPHDAEVRGQIRQLNVPTLLFDLSGRAGLMTDNIVVTLVLGGPQFATPLFLTQRLIAIALKQLQAVGGASWAALGQLHALGRRDVFNARLVELTRLVSALAVIVLVPIAAYNHAFMALWVGEAQYGGDLVTVLGCINGLLLALVSLWGWCFSGTGMVATLVPMMLASAALNVVVSVVATMVTRSIAGPLIGTCAAITCTTLWYLPVQLQKHFGTPVAGLGRAVAGPLLWGAAPAAAILWVARRLAPAGWLSLGGQVAASGLILFAVWWFGELKSPERALYLERVRLALGRGGAA